jgi:hypothetical protein
LRASSVVDRLGVTSAAVVEEPEVVPPVTDDPGPVDELVPGVVG